MHLEPVQPSKTLNTSALYAQGDGPKGGFVPPPPPPPPSAPPPPGSNMGNGPKAPPPPGGLPGGKAKAVAAKELADMSASERKTWVGKLKFHDIYPDDARILVELGFGKPSTVQSKLISDAKHKQPSQAYYQAEVLRLLNQAYSYPPEVFDLYKAEMEKELKAYALPRDSKGLVNAYNSLIKWNCFLKLHSEQDQNYLHVKEQANQLQSEYAALLVEFQALKESSKVLSGVEQENAFANLGLLKEQMQSKVSALKEAQDKIKINKATLGTNQENFESIYSAAKSVEFNAQKNIERIQASIALKSKNAGNPILDPNGMIQRDVEELERELITAQASLQAAIDTTAEKKLDIDAAEKKYKDSFQKVQEQSALHSLLTEPPSWKSIKNMKIGAKMDEQKVVASQDPEYVRCMDIDGKRSFNIRFLSSAQQARLAWFFAAEAKDVQDLLPINREQQRALMITIDGRLGQVEKLNFKMLMDIAEGKIKRDAGAWAGFGANDLLKNIVIDDSITPNYEALEAQYNRFNFHKDYKEDEAKNAFFEANKQRGITFAAEAIAKGKKNYDFKRTIDISYLTETQTMRLADFLSKQINEFSKEDGTLNTDALSVRVNAVLNDTNLSFEKFCDIIEGHLERTPNTFAPQDNYACLEAAVRTVGVAPNYEAIVQQRKDYLQRKIEEEAARRRQEQEERAEAKRLADEQKHLKQQELTEQAQSTAQEIINSFAEIIPNADFSNPRVLNTFDLYLKAGTMQIEDKILKEMVDELLQTHLQSLRPEPVDPILPLPQQVESFVPKSSSSLNVPNNEMQLESIPSPKRQPVLFANALSSVVDNRELEQARQESVEAKAPKINSLGLSIRRLQESRTATQPSTWEADISTSVDARKAKGQYYAATLLLNPESINMNDMLQNATSEFKHWGRKFQSLSNKLQSSSMSSTLSELNAIQALIIELNLAIPDDPERAEKFIQNAMSKAEVRMPENTNEKAVLNEIMQGQGMLDYLRANQQHPDRMGINKLAILKGLILEKLEYYKYSRGYVKDNFGATCEHILNEIDRQAGNDYPVLKNDPDQDAFCKHLYRQYKSERDYYLTHPYQERASKPKM